MKTKNEIISKIDELLNLYSIKESDFASVKEDINNLKTSEKGEVLNYFIENLYSFEMLKNIYLRDPENINFYINEAKKNFKSITGYSDSEIDEFFDNADITEKNIEQKVENDLELDLKEVRKEAESKNMTVEEWLNKDVERLEKEKENKLAEIDRKIKELGKKADLSNNTFSKYLTEEFEKLTNEQSEIVSRSGGYPSEKDEKRFHEINSRRQFLRQIDGQYSKISFENISSAIEKLTNEQKDIVSGSGGYPSEKDEKRYHEINDTINILNNYKNTFSQNCEKMISVLKGEIEKLNNEQKDIVAKSGGYPSESDEKRYHEINGIINNTNKKIVLLGDLKGLSFDQINEKFNNLLAEQKDIVAKSGGYPSESDEKRYHEINDMISVLKEISGKKSEKNSNNIDLQKLKKERGKIERDYDALIANRKKQLDKLNKKVVKKGNRKDLRLKALAGVAGFGVGLAMSSVPGVGQIRMTLATAKLLQSGVNKGLKIWTKKYPEGKITKITAALHDKSHNFGEKHPRIASSYNMINKFVGNNKVQWFVNGVSAGYITGNVIELVTGKTVGQHFNSFFAPDSEIPQASVPVTPSAPEAIKQSVPSDLSVGQTYDLSGLSQGLVSSNSEDFVNLVSSAGKEAVVDQFKTLPNGEVMVHFTSGGEGYAWFKLSDVKEYLAKGSEVIETASKSL